MKLFYFYPLFPLVTLLPLLLPCPSRLKNLYQSCIFPIKSLHIESCRSTHPIFSGPTRDKSRQFNLSSNHSLMQCATRHKKKGSCLNSCPFLYQLSAYFFFLMQREKGSTTVKLYLMHCMHLQYNTVTKKKIKTRQVFSTFWFTYHNVNAYNVLKDTLMMVDDPKCWRGFELQSISLMISYISNWIRDDSNSTRQAYLPCCWRSHGFPTGVLSGR